MTACGSSTSIAWLASGSMCNSAWGETSRTIFDAGIDGTSRLRPPSMIIKGVRMPFHWSFVSRVGRGVPRCTKSVRAAISRSSILDSGSRPPLGEPIPDRDGAAPTLQQHERVPGPRAADRRDHGRPETRLHRTIFTIGPLRHRLVEGTQKMLLGPRVLEPPDHFTHTTNITRPAAAHDHRNHSRIDRRDGDATVAESTLHTRTT